MSENLPEDVMAEILCRLSMKSIIQCTCVCKSWNSVIKKPNFIATHFQKTLSLNKAQNRHLFLHRFYNKYGNYQFSLRFDNKDLDEYMPLHPPFDPENTIKIVGSCNGLICFFHDDFSYGRYGFRLILWNPYIRKSFLLPLPKYIFVSDNRKTCRLTKHFIGFGFDSRTHDYKVLRIMNPPIDDNIHFRTELYSLNSNSWKDITDIAPNYSLSHSDTAVFVNDALHWIVNIADYSNCRRINNFKGNLVAVFDFRDDVFRQIPLPECLANNRYSSELRIKVFGDSSIAVVHQNTNYPNNESPIWVMKEYGVVSSWVKFATVGKRYRGMSRVLEFRSNGEVLIEFRRGGLASQNITSQRLKNLTDYKKGGSYFCSYVESLALLDKGDDAGNTRYAGGENFLYISRKPKRTKTCNATDAASSKIILEEKTDVTAASSKSTQEEKTAVNAASSKSTQEEKAAVN